MEQAYSGKCWRRPGCNYCGEKLQSIGMGGMENGLDLTLTTKHYNWYVKQGKMSQAAAIMAVFTGASRPGARLELEDEMYKCPFCHMAGYDEIHLFYTCPKLITNRHPMI
eukprot:6954302-Karenia_brevis.AAC.1